jgi:hypothetical protein
MPLVQLFGAANKGKSSNVSAQRRLNMYAEILNDADKTHYVLYGRPGLTPVSYTTDIPVSGPVRGMIQYSENGGVATQPLYEVLLAVISNYFVQFSPVINGYYVGKVITATNGGPLGNGRVRFAYNGIDVLAVDGAKGYNANDPVPYFIPSANFPNGATTCCFIAGRFIVDDPSAAGRFRWCHLLDIDTWDALDFATAESNPDPLTGVLESQNHLVLIGTQSIEFWSPTSDTEIFVNVGGTTLQWGTSYYDTVAKVEGGFMFMGRLPAGTWQVLRVVGYQAQVVSDPDVEYSINAEAHPEKITALSYTVAGHQFYQINLTTTTWVYDFRSGMWSEWQTAGSRFAPDLAVSYQGQTLVADYRASTLYALDTAKYTDNGTTIMREFTGRHITDNLDRISCPNLTLDMETGVGLTSGQGSAPQIMLQVSKDGGHTFGSELWASMGAVGNYLTRVVWRRLGVARDWVFRFRVSDPVKVVVLMASVNFEK